MSYSTGQVYHLYNQSNSYVPIFREAENYRFFLQKIRTHLLPVADVLCYCLMPDHFHLLISAKAEGIANSVSIKPQSVPREGKQYQQAISHQLRIMLSSYSRAYNRRYKNRGNLFRIRTNAKEVDSPGYRVTCFHYIHRNPVKDGICAVAEKYPHSSAADWAGRRDLQICNYTEGKRLIGIERGAVTYS